MKIIFDSGYKTVSKNDISKKVLILGLSYDYKNALLHEIEIDRHVDYENEQPFPCGKLTYEQVIDLRDYLNAYIFEFELAKNCLSDVPIMTLLEDKSIRCTCHKCE